MTLNEIIVGFAAVVLLYLIHVNYAMARTPPEAQKFSPHRWTKEEIREAYERTKKSPTDVKKHLPPKAARRYIVVGGSGLVGGWIVQHLLLRGEDPPAIRILDIQAPTRPEVSENNVLFIRTDVSDASSVSAAFTTLWHPDVANLPLTVFHTVAHIKPTERKRDFLAMYDKVNVTGTRNVVSAAKKAGAGCLVATSSGSVGLKCPKYFLAPWSKYPRDMFQVLQNAEPRSLNMDLEEFGAIYPYSKLQGEKIVREADSKEDGFRTGCIRPGHAIYGHGVENPSSVSWDYLRRGGSPTWLYHVVSNFVSAQNVSIAHLLFESKLIRHTTSSTTPDIGGRAYCVTDPNPPITFGDLYLLLLTLASTPMSFPKVPAVPLLLLAYVIEAYTLLQHRFLTFLPKVTGDIEQVQPGMFNISTVHIVYDDTLAKQELGYRAPIETLEGLCLQLLDWNQKHKNSEVGHEGAKDEAPKSGVPVVPVGVGR